MSASKDQKRGTWKVYIRYTDWTGTKQIHTKRGFATKKLALEYERDFLQRQSKDINMSFEAFVELYMENLKPRLKYNTYLSKKDRIRVKQINIRLTDTEYAYLHDKARSCELTMSDYIRKIIMDGVVVKYETFNIKELSNELNKIGVNINQIAYHVNSKGGEYDRQDIDNLISEFSELESIIFKRVWGIG